MTEPTHLGSLFFFFFLTDPFTFSPSLSDSKVCVALILKVSSRSSTPSMSASLSASATDDWRDMSPTDDWRDTSPTDEGRDTSATDEGRDTSATDEGWDALATGEWRKD